MRGEPAVSRMCSKKQCQKENKMHWFKICENSNESMSLIGRAIQAN